MKCPVILCLCLLLTLSTGSESLKILKKIKDFLHPSTTTALPERQHDTTEHHSWNGDKDSAENSDSDSHSSESHGVRTTPRPSYSAGSGQTLGGSSRPGYQTATVKSPDSLNPDHPFDVDDNSESQWGGPTTPTGTGKNTNIYTSSFNNGQSTTEQQPSYSSQGVGPEYNTTGTGTTYNNGQSTYGSDQSTSGGFQSTYDKDQSTTGSQSSYNSGQSTSAGSQSTFNNGQLTMVSPSSYNNGQSTAAGSQSSYNSGQSTSAGSQSTFNNGQSTMGSQTSYNNGQSPPGRPQSTYDNDQSSLGSQLSHGNNQLNKNNDQSTKQPDSYNLSPSTTERQTNFGQKYDKQNSNEPNKNSPEEALVFPDHPSLDPSPEPERSFDRHGSAPSDSTTTASTADPREGKAKATGVAVDDGRHVIDAPNKQCGPGQKLSNGICRTQARR